ncbi:MAG: hypothetical protein LUQ40_04035 [Methanomicrobiales archaeon]|nr:hypothetical protein [Methanomicrobiales archaeon]
MKEIGAKRGGRTVRSGRQAQKPIMCVCPKCGQEFPKAKNVPCISMICPDDKVALVAIATR